MLQGDLTVAFHYLKGSYREDGDNLLASPIVTGKEVMVLN